MKKGSLQILYLSKASTSQSLIIYPLIRQRMFMRSWQQTTRSINVILVVGGRESLITGTRPTYTTIKVAMLPILSLQSGPCTNVNRVRMVMSTSGMKIVRESIMGYLQKGILKVMTLKDRYELALSFFISSERNFQQSTDKPLSARSYSPKLPSSVKVNCQKILFFYQRDEFPTLFMQLNLNLTNQLYLQPFSGNQTSMSSKIRDSLKFNRLKGAIKSSKIVPGARLIQNYFLIVHLR